MNAVDTLTQRIKALEKAFDGDSNDAEHDAAYELVEYLKAQPKLSNADWEEIYYALEYKLTSPAIGSDREGKRWAAHIRRILKKIGFDGENMYTEVRTE